MTASLLWQGRAAARLRRGLQAFRHELELSLVQPEGFGNPVAPLPPSHFTPTHPKTTVARYDPAACGLPTGRRSFEPRTRLSYRIDPQPRCEEVQNDLACDRIPAHAALLLRSKSLLPSRDVLPEDHMLLSCRKDKQRVEREAEVISPDSCGYPPFRLALKGHPGTLLPRAKRGARQLTRADAAPGPAARVLPSNMPRSKPITIDLPC